MKRIWIVPVGLITGIVLALGILFGAYFQKPAVEVERGTIPPPPYLPQPDPVVLPRLRETHVGEKIDVSEDINGSLFENCTLEICGMDGIKISNCKLIDSKIRVYEGSRNVEISNNVIEDRYVYEDPAVGIYGCENVLIRHNEIENNSIGIAIVGGRGIDVSDNIFEANDQHNALLLDGTRGAEVHGNLFRYNYPHAILILNRQSDPEVWVDVYYNTMDRNVEDAIDFEDFSGCEGISRVYGNRVTGTGWAAINVEYNSWNANLIVEGNYIDSNGLLTEDVLDGEGRPTRIYPAHQHQPGPYWPGWKHGVKLEDCSGVIVKNNVIADNSGNGVDVKNCRQIKLEANIICGNVIGVSLMEFEESSLDRQVSPLAPENAGYSEVGAVGNVVFGNREQDYHVGQGSRLDRW